MDLETKIHAEIQSEDEHVRMVTARTRSADTAELEETEVCAASEKSLHNRIFTCPESTGRVKITRMSSVGGQGGQIRALKLHGAPNCGAPLTYVSQ